LNRSATRAAAFEPIKTQRAFEDIAAQLRALIASGQLKPGDRLPSEKELIERFGVSRNAVREALRSLELAGLVELRMGSSGGAVVMTGKPNVVINALTNLYHVGAIRPIDLTQARICIESGVVRLLCETLQESDLEQLRRNVREMREAELREDFEERARLNLQFHQLLGAATRNPVLEIMMRAIMEIMRLFVEKIGHTQKPYTLPSRRRLLRHLERRDAEAAVKEMVSFLERLHRDYMASWQKGAEANALRTGIEAAAQAKGVGRRVVETPDFPVPGTRSSSSMPDQ